MCVMGGVDLHVRLCVYACVCVCPYVCPCGRGIRKVGGLVCVALAPEADVDVDARLTRASAVGRAGVPVRVMTRCVSVRLWGVGACVRVLVCLRL